MTARAADPWRDLAVIDSRAPRFNQTVVGIVSLLAVATGWWWLLALLALQLALGLTLGRRFCLPCLVYFGLIQPRFGEGTLEDSRPPRAANMVGFAFLTPRRSLTHSETEPLVACLACSWRLWRCWRRQPGSAPAARPTSWPAA
jgi:hypothetical protein